MRHMQEPKITVTLCKRMRMCTVMRDRTTHTWAREIQLKIKFAMCERIPIPSSDTMQFSSRPLRPPKAKPQLCTKEEEF